MQYLTPAWHGFTSKEDARCCFFLFFNVHPTCMETNMFADTHFKMRHAEDERHFLANSWDSGAGYLMIFDTFALKQPLNH